MLKRLLSVLVRKGCRGKTSDFFAKNIRFGNRNKLIENKQVTLKC